MHKAFEHVNWRYTACSHPSVGDLFSGHKAELTPVKISPRRCVYRHPHGFYLKWMKYRGVKSTFKSVLGGGASREKRLYSALARRGVPVPELFALGDYASAGIYGEVLVTREVRDALTLQIFIHTEYQRLAPARKRGLVKAFALFVRMLFEQGVYHRDFHLNNVLVRMGAGDVQFWMLDVTEVVLFSRPMPWKKRVRILGLVLSKCWFLVSRSVRFRFLRYLVPQCSRAERARMTRDIGCEACKCIHAASQHRSRYSVFTNSQFYKEKAGRMKLYRKRRIRLDIEKPDVLFRATAENDQKCLMSGKIDIDGKAYGIEKFSTRSFWDGVLNVFGWSRGKAKWKNACRFPVQVVQAPDPLMMIRVRDGLFKETAFLVSSCISEVLPLDEYWRCIRADEKKRLSARLGMVIGTLYFFGVLHRQLSLSHIGVCRGQLHGSIVIRGIQDFHKRNRINVFAAKKNITAFLDEMKRNGADPKEMQILKNCLGKWAGLGLRGGFETTY
ncbi:MAG: lipopolysaccharide kinase InaA family protein [Desulfobacterales bacterium]